MTLSLSRESSALPTITKDLTVTSHRYSSDRPLNPSATEYVEPVMQGAGRGLKVKDSPTKASNISRPMISKSLPSCDILSPVTRRHDTRLTGDVVVLTPDHLETSSIPEAKPDVTEDKTFVVMPKFDDFFQSKSSDEKPSSTPLASQGTNTTRQDAEEKGKGDDEFENEEKQWTNDAPDASYDFKAE